MLSAPPPWYRFIIFYQFISGRTLQYSALSESLSPHSLWSSLDMDALRLCIAPQEGNQGRDNNRLEEKSMRSTENLLESQKAPDCTS